MRTFPIRFLAGAVLCAGVAVPFLPASDHREAPLIQEDLPADLADVYAFLSPTNPDNFVMAMTVNPFSVKSESTTYNFSENVRYRFLVDTNLDFVEDAWINVKFKTQPDASQTFTANFNDVFTLTGDVTAPTLEPNANPPVIVNGPQDIKIFAGPRDDPFFFDVVGFNRVLAGTGTFSGSDGFAGFNTSAIVIELPLRLVSPSNAPFAVWAETERRKQTIRRADTGQLQIEQGDWQQIDRVGNPGVSTALIPFELKDLYNIGEPINDPVDFAQPIIDSLTALGTNPTNIGILASIAVPDVLKVDPNGPIAYPNGRNLEDDVIDTLLDLIFNQTGVTDLVPANDVPFRTSFPYLADPIQAK